MTTPMYDWIHRLPEVGDPIRDEARRIDTLRDQARQRAERARRDSAQLERELMHRVRKLWTTAEIAEARAALAKARGE